MPRAGGLWPTVFPYRRGFSRSSMGIEPLIKRDPSHRSPICGGDTELVSITFTHRDGEHGEVEQQVEVTSPRRRCANLQCKGHNDDRRPIAERSLAILSVAAHSPALGCSKPPTPTVVSSCAFSGRSEQARAKTRKALWAMDEDFPSGATIV
jgi:hypothetical protein